MAPEIVSLNAFDPSAERGSAVGARMQARLANSLRYILSEMEKQVPVPGAGIEGFLTRLDQGPVSPLAFGAYCDLVLALEMGALDAAQTIMQELANHPNVTPGPAIRELADPDRDAPSERYRRVADSDEEMPISILPPSPQEYTRVRDLIMDAFALTDSGNPALAGEMRAILREVVLATGSEDPKAIRFDGVSSFMLWGGVILNVQGPKTVLDMVQTLSHESGHNLLFGLCAYGPLHDNDDVERYPSPLRTDVRPMDGVVHATYVTARMHQAVQRLLDAGVLDEAQRDEARKANVENAKAFASGMETVSQHAKLTPLGREVMGGAVRYMSAYR